MKTKPTIIVLAVIALAGGFAVRATREAVQTKAAIDAFASQRAGLRETIASVEQRLRTANDAFAKVEQRIRQPPGELGAGVGANAAASGNDTAAKPATPVRRLSADTIIANDPQKMAAYVQNFRASLDFTYGGMFKALGLSAGQIEELKDLKVLLEQRRMDLIAAAQMLGLDGNSETYKTLKAEHEEIRMAKEAEILGDLAAPYHEYNRTQVVRDLAQELAGTAVYSGQPVPSAQVERTAQVLAVNSQRFQTGDMRGWVTPNTVNWEAASAQLQDVLSPAQIATLGIFIHRDAAQAKMVEQWKRLTAEFKAKQAAK